MRFAAPAADYSDFAGGQVLHSAPGFPGFPARLAIELFERARLLTGRTRVGVWDPMCGAGGIVTTLGLARPEAITRLLATDISADAVALASKNLGLVSEVGLRRRARELAGRSAARAAAAERLRMRLEGSPPIDRRTAVLDATRLDGAEAHEPGRIDIVITDLPYGHQTRWAADSEDPAPLLLDRLRARLPAHAVIVLCSTRREDFGRLPHPLRAFRHGKRVIKLYRADHGAERYGTV